MKMSLAYDQKEDLRQRMADLEQKLAESEEERKKLEKTCNLLVRAFREEEKMHYKTLNNKYEKFLEDCNLRRRRNDIILRSLCRVEDRARALYVKTERLKLLKDRFVSYLKPLEFKKEEFSLPRNTTTSSVPLVVDDFISKSVHWKSPNVAEILLGHNSREAAQREDVDYLKNDVDNLEASDPVEEFHETFVEKYHRGSLAVNKNQNFQPTLVGDVQKESILGRTLHSEAQSGTFIPKDQSDLNEISIAEQPLTKLVFKQFKDSIGRNDKIEGINEIFDSTGDQKWKRAEILENSTNSKTGPTDLEKITTLRERVVIRHQESIEKLKTALSFEEEIESENEIALGEKNVTSDQKTVIEKDEIENNEKHILLRKRLDGFFKSDGESLSLSNVTKENFSSDNDEKIKYQQEGENVVENEILSNSDLPMGLDGVDYQNETYPESYYEQPVHLDNYFSIASNVILEEDEYEQEGEQQKEETNQNTSFKSEINYRTVVEPVISDHQFGSLSADVVELQSATRFPRNNGFVGNPPVKEHNSDQSLREDGGKVNGLPGYQIAEQNGMKDETEIKKSPAGLIHLLESDSESFQIEHGTANDDSDFDFSFHQN